MSIRQRFNILLFGMMASSFAFAPASSRTWKATPTQIAGEYALIGDNKSATDHVIIRWWAAPTVEAGTPLAGILEKYVVVSVVHFHNPPFTMSFDDIDTLEARDDSGQPLVLVPRSQLPPMAIGILAGMEAASREGLGRLGVGTKFFVFDAGTVRACQKGGISIPFEGETYTWETPFPGCAEPREAPRSRPRAPSGRK
jgi:hypothetical protein